MDPKIQVYQQALLSRGIRLAEDDPLFSLLVLNEMHFNDLVSNHLAKLDKQMIAEVVARVLEKQPKEFVRCQGGASAEKSAERLEAVASYFSQLENQTYSFAQNAARASGRETAGKMITDMARRIDAELMKLEMVEKHSKTVNDSAKRMLMGAKDIYNESQKIHLKLLAISISPLILLVVGLFIGYRLGH